MTNKTKIIIGVSVVALVGGYFIYKRMRINKPMDNAIGDKDGKVVLPPPIKTGETTSKTDETTPIKTDETTSKKDSGVCKKPRYKPYFDVFGKPDLSRDIFDIQNRQYIMCMQKNKTK